MDTRQRILEAATVLLESESDPDKVTIRAVAAQAGIAVGLINYHFGSRDNLMAACAEVLINRVVARFEQIRNDDTAEDPFEKLQKLGDLTFTFLFEHEALSRLSVLTDARSPKERDNTDRTTQAFLPLVRACRPDLDDEQAYAKTFALISSMQSAFLRKDALVQKGIDLEDPQQRAAFHKQILETLGLAARPETQNVIRHQPAKPC